MPVNTIDPRDFLQPKLIEGVINKKLESSLSFVNMFPVVPTDATAVTYSEDLVTAGADLTSGTMAKPLDMGELSGLSQIEVSPITQKHGMLRPFGYEFRVSKKDLERGQVIDDLTRGVGRAAYGMKSRINSDVLTILKGAASTNDITEPYQDRSGNTWTAWSEDGATPISNMLQIEEAMDIEGYDSECNTIYLQSSNYYELMDYTQNIDINWVQNPMANTTKQIPQINGVNIIKLKGTGELAAGAYMGMDARPEYAPITIYAYSQNGMGKDAEVPIINVFQYTENPGSYKEMVVTEFVAETFYALKAPNSVCYRASSI